MAWDTPVSHHLDLYRYWLLKRGARRMPSRGDLNPGDIPALLPFLLIVGKAEGQLRYRLSGSAVVQAAGHDATGSPVGSYLASAKDAADARAIFERVFAAGCPVFASGEFIFKSGARLNMSLLTLPFSEDGAAVNVTVSTIIPRFAPSLVAQRGWLKGLPAKVCDVIDVGSAEELKRLCFEWERRSELAT
jgi:hypothetical protein